ncbi:MAG: sterol desaturase family protein [Acidimicrobiia bacterium]
MHPKGTRRHGTRDPVVMILRSRVAAAIAGAVSWTLVEYALHRGAMHEMRGRGLPSVEHLGHHADVTYFSPASKKIASAVATTAVAYPVAVAMSGRRRAIAFTGGLITMYFAYEVAHRRTHTHPPRGPYGRWARRNHLHHHFAAPMRNFGVTSPVWDRLLGTYDEPGVVTVPRRMAPKWMVDETGALRGEFAADYVVVGGGRLETSRVDRDRGDAFANVAPQA